MRKHYLALAATAALGITLTACSSNDGDTSTPAEATISHIHGLGIDPADGRLYVATHEGIFTPGVSGAPQRVGDSQDDFMGFTVARAKTFLASGHPGPGSSEPGNRGLIESTDAGKTWKTKSLAGKVDFHALDYVNETIYGYDSTNGLLRVSKDGITWDDRAKLRALDIATSPVDPDVVLATTQEGVAKSTDGGRTFATGTQPVMAFVSWAKPDALYGINPAGALSRSTDGGATWMQSTTIPGGQPQALTAVDAQHLLAATQNGVYESKDGGKTFTKRLNVSSGAAH
ncbi:exo-alpha-sialidase [Streptomyces sp. NBC_00160]|uniref:F510_1955 family glycosylhydrolase n=1 Tax=Streptomyces sp. NBC_00160 TaxID=2903628 RepID=UPI00224C82A2|nr:exo-alpha-sialidase [Streptomyces sp. NBC_00160]MCX5302744.1 exo-alpha-sialidase [Streptomyces sp. NBC_00160]